MKTIIKSFAIVVVLLSLLFTSCRDEFFEVDNAGIVTGQQIDDLNTDSAASVKIAQSLMLGIYTYLNQSNTQGSSNTVHEDFGLMGIYHLGDVMNDDLAFHVRGSGWFTYDYELDYWSQQYKRPFFYWNFFYTVIAKSNAVIHALDLNSQNPEVKAVLGQAYAFRAMSHFYLAQMFQLTYIGNEDMLGVPIKIDPKEGESINTRAPLRKVYEQVSSDFEKSMNYLDGWNRPTKIYINKNAAAGLYSRVCLVMNRWDDAATYASMARGNQATLTIEELGKEGFNFIGSKEWIWGADITSETATKFASFFSFVCSYDAGYGGDVGQYRKIDAGLYLKMSLTDARRKQFKLTTSGATYTDQEKKFAEYTNIKFKKVANWEADYVFMRVSEMILTEAEALARAGNEEGAASVLKLLMQNRDPDWDKTSVTGDEVYQQRRLELWGEGFSLFDHLRLNKDLDRAYSGSNHLGSAKYKIKAGSRYFLFQIPLRELDNNNELDEKDQNPIPTGGKYQ